MTSYKCLLSSISYDLMSWSQIQHTQQGFVYHFMIYIDKSSLARIIYSTSCKLTHCGLAMHKATRNWVSIGSGNGLLPDGNKPLPEPMLTYHQSCGIHRRTLPWENLKIPISKTRLKITFLESHSDFPGANELTTETSPQFILRVDSRVAPSQWETALLCNDVSHWLGASLESALHTVCTIE